MSAAVDLRELPTTIVPRPFAKAATPRKEKIEPHLVDPSTTYLSLEHIEGGGARRLLGSGIAADVKSTKSRFYVGDVLYGRLRPYLNKVWVADRDGICSTDIIVLEPAKDVEPSFLALFLVQPIVVRHAHDQSSGDLPRVAFEALAELEIPVPPLEAQSAARESTAALSDRAVTALARVRTAREKVLLAQAAVLRLACTGAVTEDWRDAHPDVLSAHAELEVAQARSPSVKTRRGVPSEVEPSELVERWELPAEWAAVSVAELLRAAILHDVKDGNHGSNHPKVAEFGEVGLPFITAAHVTDDRIDYAAAPKIDGAPLAKLRVGFAEPHDVILTHKGTVGRVAIAEQSCVLSPQTTYYRCDPLALSPAYLAGFLASPLFQRQLEAVMSQTTRDFVPISEQYRLFVALPPRLEQDLIANYLADRREGLRRTTQRVTRLESLTAALELATASAAFNRLRSGEA